MGAGFEVMLAASRAIEEALEWKCCNLSGMNFELRVRNTGDGTARIRSEAVLEGAGASEHVPFLYPPGLRAIEPGETAAFYFSLDESIASGLESVTIFDDDGRRYTAPVTGRSEPASPA